MPGEQDHLDVVLAVAGLSLDREQRIAVEGCLAGFGGVDREVDGRASAVALPADLKVVGLRPVEVDIGERAVGEQQLDQRDLCGGWCARLDRLSIAA